MLILVAIHTFYIVMLLSYINHELCTAMETKLEILVLISFLLVAFSCHTPQPPAEENSAAENEEQLKLKPLVEEILTAEEQAALTPDEVFQILKDGNQRFLNNDLTARDHSQQVRKSVSGQFPKAVVLSCLDSRIPVEDVFDRGIGDIFVARVAGNFVNQDILGSMEFGCKVAGAKLILVMGHESCGAVKAAIDGVELGNITNMLSKINPAVQKSQGFEGEKTSTNSQFVTYVSENNVRNTIKTIREESPILKEMEHNGEIRIMGAIYDMDMGSVTFIGDGEG